MKRKIVERGICLLLTCAMLASALPATAANWSEFTDISGHWSEEAMKTAYDNGLLEGYDDNTIRPDKPVSKAEILTFLTRVLAAGADGDMSGTEIGEDEWYYDATGRALALGIVNQSELDDMDGDMSRQDVFVYVARAFQLAGAEQDLSVLDRFADSGTMKYEARAAAAALVEQGYVEGTGDGLDPEGSITRGQIVTILGRIVGSYLMPEDLESSANGGVSIPATGDLSADASALADDEDEDGPEAERSPDQVYLSDLDLDTYLLINGAATSLTLEDVTSKGKIVVRSDRLEDVAVSGGSVDHLVLAAASGDIAFAPEDGGSVDTVTVGGGSGTVRLDGDISHVEITGSNRLVYLDMDSLESLSISGRDNLVYIAADTSVDRAAVVYGATGNTVDIFGRVGELSVVGDGNTVVGSGHVNSATIRGIGSSVYTDTDVRTVEVDYGLTGVDVALTASNDPVPAGGGLQVTAAFTGVLGDATVGAQWYENGSPVEGFGNDAFDLTADRISAYSPVIEFYADMPTSVTVGLELTYTRSGEYQRVYREITVPIENYPHEYYYPPDPIDEQTWSESYSLVKNADILSEVTTEYRGNYTLSYNKDYTTETKENFVNARDYSSDTGYLVWVNLGTQKTHIFTGSKGNWSLTYTFVVTTGSSATPTPRGVFKTTYKQSGWWTESYTAKPVVRFKGGGYAFHSRLYYPGSSTLKDGTIGAPVSAGCVRMYDTDIQWMYDYLPNGSTVVVY